ncbi:MAG: phage tail protein [Bacteroidota bacterium]
MAEYPMSTLHFQVEWGGTRASFSEVSGLTIEYEVIEYRGGSDLEYGSRKMPGRPKYGNIVLKRGILPGDNELFDWINSIQLNAVERRDVVISLLNESHEPVFVWKVRNAFPVRLEGPTLRASGNEVAIESLELAHEGLRIESVGGKRSKS